jgi:hypothetical protein
MTRLSLLHDLDSKHDGKTTALFMMAMGDDRPRHAMFLAGTRAENDGAMSADVKATDCAATK